jgi:DNA polymerase-1
MLKVESDQVLRDCGARLLLQVHDELVLECPKDPEVVKVVKKRVQEIMENPFGQQLRVPLPAEVGDGWTWATAK